jgi:hypothetical protein
MNEEQWYELYDTSAEYVIDFAKMTPETANKWNQLARRNEATVRWIVMEQEPDADDIPYARDMSEYPDPSEL